MSELSDLLLPHVLDAFRRSLEVSRLDPHDNFFELGGGAAGYKSLGRVLTDMLGERVHGPAVFDAPSAAAMSDYLASHYTGSCYGYLGLDKSCLRRPVETIVDAADLDTVRRLIPDLKPRAQVPESKNPPATFIVSAPRSGSTLFRTMLAAHPQLFVPPELNLLTFDSMQDRRIACDGRYGFMLEGSIEALANLHACTLAEAENMLRGFEQQGMDTAGFYRHLQGLAAKRSLVEKSTSYAMDRAVLDRAEQEFSNARFIHLCRHPSAVVQSFEEARFDRLFYHGSHPFSASELGELMWMNCNHNISGFLEDIPDHRQLDLQFETLLKQPQQTMQRVCDFLGVGFDDALLEPYSDAEARMASGFATEDPKFYSFDRLEVGTADRWKSNPRRRHLSSQCWQIAEKLGYPREPMRDSEQRKITTEWNVTAKSYPDDRLVHQLFERQVEKTPDAVALEIQGRQISYGQLNAASNRLANYLRELGAGPDMLVAMCLERSEDAVVALLAILKADAAYLPIDPQLPEERRAFMLKDATVSWCLTGSDFSGDLDVDDAQVISLEQVSGELLNQSSENPESRGNNRQLMYTIYTSGSTGQPKGVMVEHRGFCNALTSHISTLGLRPGSRTLQLVSFSFDAASLHLLMSLCSGATVVMTDMTVFGKDPAGFLKNRKITHLPLPASVLETVPCADLPDLEVITVGAEVCPPKLAERWSNGQRFYNMYGPTETTVLCTSWLYRKGYRRLPIGKPIANMQVYILDESMQAVPIGVDGEIYIGGAGLARGYLNRPELNKEKFVQNPFGDDLLYRSGDLGMFLPDGNIVYTGRADNQIKLSGFRIELEEIEAVIRRCSHVRQAAVIRHRSQLLAYVVIAGDLATDADVIEEIRTLLIQFLPAHMVPAGIRTVESFPLTHAGKVDREALGVLYTQSLLTDDHIAARDDIEQSIITAWQEIFQLESIGVKTNFLDIGGDSLLAVRMCATLSKVFAVELQPEIIFRAQTVEQLAKLIRAENVKATQYLLPVYTGGSKMPVYFAQAGRTWQSLHREIGEDRPLYGMKPFYGEIDVAQYDSLASLVEGFVREILDQKLQTPCCLAGYSLGAVAALEMARQLQAAGKQVALVHLLDPIVTKSLADARPMAGRLADKASKLKNHLLYRFSLAETHAIKTAKRWFGDNDFDHVVVDQRQYDVSSYRYLADSYALGHYDGRVLVSYSTGYRRRCWQPVLTGEVEYKRIHGLHEELTTEERYIQQWVQHLAETLDDIGL